MHTHACMGSQVCKKRLSSQYCCKCEHRTGRLVRGALRAIPQDFRTLGAQSNPPGLQGLRAIPQDFRTPGLRAIPQDFRTPGAQSNPPGLQDPRALGK